MEEGVDGAEQRVLVGAGQLLQLLEPSHDAATGLVYNRARMLNPRLQRFNQRDPLGYVDGMSLYEYISSNSVKWLDPIGANKCGACGPADRCCATWEPGWQLFNYPDKKTCFVTEWQKLSNVPALLVQGGVAMMYRGLVKDKKASLISLFIAIGGSVGAMVDVITAYELCDDEWCIKTRKADSVFVPWFQCLSCKKCGCLDLSGNLGDLEKSGDRRSP